MCVDLFVMSSSYVDVATLSRLCHPTAGQLYHYSPWVPEIDASRVANDLRWNLYRPQACALGSSWEYRNQRADSRDRACTASEVL